MTEPEPLFEALPDSCAAETGSSGPGRPARTRRTVLLIVAGLVSVLVAAGLMLANRSDDPAEATPNDVRPAARTGAAPPAEASDLAPSIAPATPAPEGSGEAELLFPGVPGGGGGRCDQPASASGITVPSVGTGAAPSAAEIAVGPTGVRVRVNGHIAVDLDRPDVRSDPVAGITENERVAQSIRVGSTLYLWLIDCRGTETSRFLEVSASGRVWDLASTPEDWALLPGEGSAWLWWTAGIDRMQVELRSLAGGPPVLLPIDMFPVAVHGDLLIATGGDGAQNNLVVFDLANRTVRDTIAPDTTAYVIAGGSVFWSATTCQDAPCPLHRYRIESGAGEEYGFALPESFRLSGAALSPDGRWLTGVTETLADAETLRSLASVDLRTGDLETIPGVDLAPFSSLSSSSLGTGAPALLWSADGTWLIIADAASGVTSFWVWQPGMDQPVRRGSVPYLAAMGQIGLEQVVG